MVRASKKNVNGVTAELNPELEERKRLKKLAFSKNILSETPARAYAQLSPSKTVIKHHGKDILKKSQRKNRFLFSFPGLLAPITGGKIGELKDLGTKNPILYLDFPQGQMKLFGTIVYPKNSYLTLQFSRGGKNVMCEDYFDTMIVFSDAWWIGKKDENPNENRLEFPEELNEGQPVDCDFKGGAGATSEIKMGANISGMKSIEEQSHKTELENDSSDDENKLIDLMEATPVRHSERTAGETLNYTDASSGSDSVYKDADIFQEKIEVGVEGASSSRAHTLGKTEKPCPVVINVDNGNAAARMPPTRSEEISPSNHRSLVQATISTLFKKARKKAPTDLRKSPSGKVSGHKMQHRTLKRKIDQADGPRKKGKVIGKEKAGSETTAKKKQSEVLSSVEPDKVYQRKTKGQAASASSVSVDDPVSPDPISNLSAASSQVEDDIEDFSSTSQDIDDSDEDWAA